MIYINPHMDAIRLRQIREALDCDKRMYAQAFELEKRRVSRMGGSQTNRPPPSREAWSPLVRPFLN